MRVCLLTRTSSVARSRIQLWLQTTQEDGDDGCDVLLIRQTVCLKRWEEQLAPKLGQQHADEGAGAGAYVMGPQAAELDLAREVRLDEVEDARNHPPAQLIHHLGSADHFRQD